MYSAGTAYLTVTPSFKGIEKAFAAEAKRLGRAVEASLGDALRNATGDHARNGQRDGDEYGGAFARAVRGHLDKAERATAKIKVDADTDPFTRAIVKAKEELGLLRDAKIGVDLNEGEFFTEVARIVSEIEALDHTDATIELRTNAAQILAELRAVQAMKDSIERDRGNLHVGDQTSHVGADVDTAAANTKLDELAAKVAELNKRKISIPVDFDITKALADMTALTAEIETMSTKTIDIRADINIVAAAASLKALSAEVKTVDGNKIKIGVDIVGAAAAMTTLKTLGATVKGLDGNTIKININIVGAAAAKTTLTALAAQVKGLNGKGVKVNISIVGASAARTTLGALATQVKNLSGKSIRISIDIVGAAAAKTTLGALTAQVKGLDGKTIKIGLNVNTTAGRTKLAALATVVKNLNGKTIRINLNITGAAAAIAALTAILALTRAIRSSRASLIPPGASGAVSGVGDSANFAISRLQALIAIGISLGTALVPIGAAVAASISAIATAATAAVAGIGVFILGIFGVIKAVSAMQKAETDQKKAAKSESASDNQIANALDGVRDAYERLKQTREEVSRGAEKAARAVVDANKQVIAAEKDALKAEQDLLRAKREAQQEDEDRAFSIRDNALAQRQATLDIADAEKELRKLMRNPRATKAEREEAQITFDQRKLQMEELQTQGGRLADEQKRVAKEGADVVVSAQERVAQATDSVAKAQQDLADAVVEQTRQQVDGQRQVIDAQQAVVRSQRALQQAYVSSSTAGGAAMTALQQAMDGLSPAGRRFAKFLFGLKKDFKDLQTAAETGMLPGLQTAIQSLVPYFPAIKDFTHKVAEALGAAFVGIATTLQDPVWQQWFGYIAQTAAPALTGMIEFIMNVLTGLTGIFNALTGFNAPIGGGLLKWSEMFRDWASHLGTNSHFAKFLAYVRESAPVVLHFFGTLWEFLKRIVIASAPLGVVVLQVLTTIFEWINKIPMDALVVMLGTLAGIAVAFLAVGAVMGVIATGAIGGIIIAIAALVASFAFLYIRVKLFREIVDGTIHVIGASAMWLWKNAFKPAFEWISDFVTNTLAPAFVWLWKTSLKPTFDAISKVVLWLWNYVFKPAFTAIAWIIEKIIVPVFSWLWHDILEPIFTGIDIAVRIVWAVIQVIFGLIQIAVKILAAAFTIAWNLWIKPWFDKFIEWIKTLWEKIKPFVDWITKIWEEKVGPAFSRFGDVVAKIWDAIQDKFRLAVVFTVDVLLNDGILAAYNWLANKFDVDPRNVRISLPASFYGPAPARAAPGKGQSRGSLLADGGYISGPGGPRDDLIQAWLSNGEYVIPAHVVGDLGVDYFDTLIGRRKGRTAGAAGQMYAEGGFVSFMKSAWGKLTDPIQFLKDQASKLIDKVPGGPLLKNMVISPVSKIITKIIDRVTGALSGGGSSGGDFGPGPGFPPWPSSPSASRGDSGVWRSIVALIKSTGPMSGEFGNAYRAGDPLWHGSGRAVDWMGFNQDNLASWLSVRKPLELIHRTDRQDFAFTRGVDKGSFHEALMEEHRNHVHIAMDSGGWLMPGMSHIWNGTGAPEPVLTGDQWATMKHVVNQDGHSERHVTYNFGSTTLDASRLRAHDDAEAARARINRAR